MPTHAWDALSDTCRKCGDKDWFADRNCDESKVDNIKRDVSTILKGDKCTVNGSGDLFCEHESRDFINANCVFIKKTKSGLIQVALENNPKKMYSVPLKNIEIIE